MRKGRVVIVGSVNNDFKPLEKLTDRSLERDGPTGRKSGRGWPISCGRSGRYRDSRPLSGTRENVIVLL